MIAFNLQEMAETIDARVVGENVSFESISTDSRELKKNQLFVAIKGDRFDGHDYVDTAKKGNAIAALVDHEMDVDLPQLIVKDTRLGLGRLSAAWRQKAKAVVVGITGSNGKTTLKEMISAILLEQDTVLATAGNFNNDIGLPLTLARLQEEHFAVIEMGASHPGEIDYLSLITQPDIAVLNNAGRAHLEGFGSLEGVAKAKLEIINGLSESGAFIFNADDKFASLWREAAKKYQSIGFGFNSTADIKGDLDSINVDWSGSVAITSFEVIAPKSRFRISLPLLGKHNCMNALAAIAVATQLDISEEKIVLGLLKLQPVNGRLFPCLGLNYSRVIDDSYNANPDSVKAAIEVLASVDGNKIFVLGDLAELGSDIKTTYAELGEFAKSLGIDAFYTVGKNSGISSFAFGDDGQHFDNKVDLIAYLKKQSKENDVILIKGSRSAVMEDVVKAISIEGSEC